MLLPMALWLAAATPAFDYDKARPFDIRTTESVDQGGVTVDDISYQDASGGRNGAYLVRPAGKGPFAAILYVHWYDPEDTNSDRTQYLYEAVTLARRGVVSLHIDTMWSVRDWFPKRNRDADFDATVRQVKELRRALDLLTAQPGVDPKRVAYTGHDFGAMFGAVLASLESKRVAAWALQAGTPQFADWYLLGTRLEPAGRQKIYDEMAPLDPAAHIAKAAPSPVLFQFATEDRFVPKAKAEAFFAAAAEPKELKWYNALHGLDRQSVADRMAWLAEKLALPKPKAKR